MDLIQRFLEQMQTDRAPWYKRKFRSVPKVEFNAKYPVRHQGAKECARRQRQKERNEAKPARSVYPVYERVGKC